MKHDICIPVRTTVQLMTENFKTEDGWIFSGVVFPAKSMAMLISSFVFKVIGRQPRDNTSFSLFSGTVHRLSLSSHHADVCPP